ncbi:MAG: hypothetical protein AAB801_01075 [Patescibacteria group bacterium]
MTEPIELPPAPERAPSYGAIVIPSYGMSKWETGSEYRLSFFSGVVTRAAYELWKKGVAPRIIIEGAKIFPGDPNNDGDLMKQFLVKLAENDGLEFPEDSIVQRRDNKNTYTQIADAKSAVQELGITQKVLTVYCDLHELRVPALIRKYGINSDTRVAEEVLSEKYPAFAEVWNLIKSDPSYKRTKAMEFVLFMLLKIDPYDTFARFISSKRFKSKGADVPDVRHRRTVRSY